MSGFGKFEINGQDAFADRFGHGIAGEENASELEGAAMMTAALG